jgi:hypothetical protein
MTKRVIAKQKEGGNSHLNSKGKVVACYFLHCCASSVPSRGIGVESGRDDWKGKNLMS